MRIRAAARGILFSALLAAAAPVDPLTQGRELARLAISDPDQFLARSDPKFIEEMGGREKLRAFLATLKSSQPKGENLYRAANELVYQQAGFVGGSTLARTEIILNPTTGQVIGFSVTPIAPKAPNTHANYRSKVLLTLPFRDPPPGYAWHALWAGPGLVDNYHTRRDTYYAIDISPRAIVTTDRPNSANATKCWGLPIVAAADGIVARALDGVADQIDLRSKNSAEGPGNYVIINHGNQEFTLYAHLQKGSVPVKAGDKIYRGMQVGTCGNSGASTGPHLHFQLMNGPDPDKAEGLPPVFRNYFAPVRYVREGTITRGDFVLPGILPQANPGR